jgi:hypothetical protein
MLKYVGYLGTPNEDNGIRVYFGNNTDNIFYDEKSVTEILDSTASSINTAYEPLGNHIKDFNNPHKVTAKQVEAMTLDGDNEYIYSNKTFINNVTITNLNCNSISVDGQNITNITGDNITQWIDLTNNYNAAVDGAADIKNILENSIQYVVRNEIEKATNNIDKTISENKNTMKSMLNDLVDQIIEECLLELFSGEYEGDNNMIFRMVGGIEDE